MMSDTYGSTTAEGERRWLFNRSQLIREYLSKPPLPPPLNVAWHFLVEFPRYVYRRVANRSKYELDLSGYRLVPSLKSVQRYENVEAEAQSKFKAQQEVDKRLTNMAQLERLQADILRVELVQRSNFESMSGQFDDVNGKLQNQFDDVNNQLRALRKAFSDRGLQVDAPPAVASRTRTNVHGLSDHEDTPSWS